jgi:hypothetical protein
VDKKETLAEIAELVALQERAIANHPPKVGAVFERGRGAFLAAEAEAIDEDALMRLGLTRDEAMTASKYMLSSSFISAYYHLLGDKARRDQGAHSCTMLIGSLGEDSEQTFRQYLRCEQLWRETMRRERIAPRNRWTMSLAVAGGVVVLALVGLCAR